MLVRARAAADRRNEHWKLAPLVALLTNGRVRRRRPRRRRLAARNLGRSGAHARTLGVVVRLRVYVSSNVGHAPLEGADAGAGAGVNSLSLSLSRDDALCWEAARGGSAASRSASSNSHSAVTASCTDRSVFLGHHPVHESSVQNKRFRKGRGRYRHAFHVVVNVRL